MKIKSDKIMHFETSALLVIIFNLFLPLWISGSLAFLVGVLKEVWDIKHGVASWSDVLADLLGVSVGVLIQII